MRACKIQSQGLIVLLCLINMLNYLDRGIIPGAPQSFRHFITSSLGVAVTGQSVYFGLLSSAFIIGHSVLSIVFGYFALSCRPFRIIALGTSIWIVAIVICAVSEHVNSYALLIVGRVLSGAGEASFQCVAPPFIDRHAPPERGLTLRRHLLGLGVRWRSHRLRVRLGLCGLIADVGRRVLSGGHPDGGPRVLLLVLRAR
jgi:MFS family permease